VCEAGVSNGYQASGEYGMVWVKIPAGCFMMGCSPDDEDCDSNEEPTHEVTLSSFEILETEVTEAQYEAVTGDDPSLDENGGGGPNSPVENLQGWYVDSFCEQLGARLCTEAEFEYAARGGTTTRYYCGDDVECLDGIAWYDANSDGHKHDVKGKAPNAYGLYDMLGNVLSWTADFYGAYVAAPVNNPKGPLNGSSLVVRGGSFNYDYTILRVSRRGAYPQSGDYYHLGVRCCRSATCPNGSCSGTETCETCPADCGGPCCGQAGCQAEFDEDKCNCPEDCGAPCAEKKCGDDGCGGSCGVCGADQLCDSSGQCLDLDVLTWVPIPGGTFAMGCSPGDTDCFDQEKPAHSVTLSPFQILETEVTEAQYEAVTGDNPSANYNGGGGPNSPVENITWFEAKALCENLTARLCTEAEWEYAARGGMTTKHYCGDSSACLADVAWYWDNSNDGSGVHKYDVKEKAPNAYGLYDMLGNVDEWTADWYAEDYYDLSPEDNPEGPDGGSLRVRRGGHFNNNPSNLRASYRYYRDPSSTRSELGVRCCKSLEE